MSSSEVVVTDPQSVMIDGEKYSITVVPDAKSKLVLDSRTRILAELSLDDLLKDLSLVGKMLYVAYNGVATQPKLRGDVSKLQVNYMKVCSDAHSTMNEFQGNCSQMLKHLQGLFNYLLEGEEDTALLYIGYMAKTAARMAASATALKEAFDGLYTQSVEALAGAETAKGTEEEKQAALEKEQQNFEALTAKALVLKEEIAKSKVKLQQLYEEAKEAAEKHENRAFALAIVGAIMKPLGEGLGAFAGAMASSKIPVSLPAVPPAPPKEDKKPAVAEPPAEELAAQETAKEKAKEAEKELKETKEAAVEAVAEAETAKKTAEEATAKVEAAEEKLEKAEDDEIVSAREEVEEAKTEAEEAKAIADEADEKAKKAQEKADAAAEKYRLLTSAMAGLGKGLSSAGDAAIQMGKSYADIAASYNKEKQEYLKMLLDEQKEERKALADIAEYAKRIQDISKHVDLSKIVVEALHQAVGALKHIVVILTNAAELWKRMAVHCGKLTDESSAIRDVIELWKTKPQERRIELYLGARFAGQAVTYFADWKALQIVSEEYAAAASKVKAEVQSNVKKNVTTQEMLKVAIEEGKALFKATQEAQATLDLETKSIEAELHATDQLTAAHSA